MRVYAYQLCAIFLALEIVAFLLNKRGLERLCVSFLDAEMKIQICAPNKLTNKVSALRMKLVSR